LISLSIDQVGEETAHDLADHFGKLAKIQKASLEELDSLPGIGEVVARSVHDWFSKRENNKLVTRITQHVKIQKRAQKGGSLFGKTFVITGTLKNFSRDEAKEVVRAQGGSVSSSVSKQTDYVVAGENPGSKFDRANELGVKVLTEIEFQNILG